MLALTSSAPTIAPVPAPTHVPSIPPPVTHAGVVDWFNAEKGFGFLRFDDEHVHPVAPNWLDDRIFVHFSGIAGSGYKVLQEGQRVQFETLPGHKGEQAVNVRPAKMP